MVKTTLIASVQSGVSLQTWFKGVFPSTIYCMDGIRVLEDLPFCPWGEKCQLFKIFHSWLVECLVEVLGDCQMFILHGYLLELPPLYGWYMLYLHHIPIFQPPTHGCFSPSFVDIHGKKKQ